MIVRPICERDAEAFIVLCKQLDEESQYMLLEPGERTTTVDEQRNMIKSMSFRDNQMILVVEEEHKLVAFLVVMGGLFRRNRHCASVIVGVLKDFWRRGISMRLFQEAEVWAQTKNISRLELSVMTHNLAAIALYQKAGFRTEGTRRRSLYVDDAYVDEYWMAKLI
ncbi:MAG: hypothetical protein AMXMBFR76_09820 [Pseudomonadota bacterium]